MGHRLSKIYTRTGDSGTTALGDGSRVSKHSRRIAAYGTVDELNSYIGLLLALAVPASIRHCLEQVQHTLFDLGGELCLPDRQFIEQRHIDWTERWLDHFNADLPFLKEFILPGGNQAAATCHVARTVCRRCERIAVALAQEVRINPSLIAYLNRLSDLLFVVARVLARQNEGQEVLWQKNKALSFPQSNQT